jgi:uncharacterized protein (DUF433 family)
MAQDYIERREAGFYIVGSRVPIDAVVWEYWNGEEPQCIQSHYPTLTLQEVEGAIAFYLNHRDEVDKVIEENKRAEEEWIAAHPTPPEIKAKYDRLRREMALRRK